MSDRVSVKRIRSSFHLAASLIVCCIGVAPSPGLSEEKPNIVVLLVDDMGVMDTSVPFLVGEDGKPKRYPLNDYYRTPQMERLAKQGVRFSQFCAMSVCSPTRISIMTGQNGARHRTTNWINPKSNNAGPMGPTAWNWQGLKKTDITLARLLRDAGYRTIHVGKGHFGPQGSEGSDPLQLGFDVNVGGGANGQPASYYGRENYDKVHPKTGEHSPNAVPHLESYHGTDTFLTDALTLEAKRHVNESIAANKPFFLYLPHYAVHGPHNSDPRYADHYKDSGKPPQAQAFATLIEGMDKSVGDLLDHLQQIGVAEKTLFLFLGDNGSDAPLGHEHAVACAAPLRGKKGSHYEGGMRVPMIAAWASPNPDNALQKKTPIAAGSTQTQLAAVYDLFPTILQVADVDVPAAHTIDGRSLLKLFRGEKDPSRPQEFLMHYPHAPHRSDYFTTYRDEEWKVIYHYLPTAVSDGSHYQLFHLKDDPFEQTDLSSKHPDQLRKMIERMVQLLEEQKGLYPIDQKSSNELRPKIPT